MGVATEMGNQGTSNNGLREAAAITQSGGIGDVKEVHVWTNRPIWPQGGPRPASKPVPESLSWNEWLGPAAERPFANGYHPFAWRGWWDFGTGALGDMACHTFNMPFTALNLRDPVFGPGRQLGAQWRELSQMVADSLCVSRDRQARCGGCLLVRRWQATRCFAGRQAAFRLRRAAGGHGRQNLLAQGLWRGI